MSSQYFSDAEEQSNFKRAKTFRLTSPDARKNESERVYFFRILPPIKTQMQLGKGVWRMYKGQHWGYKVPSVKEPNNPEKAWHKTFLCIQETDFNTRGIRVHCPECDSIAATKKSRDAQFNAELKRLEEIAGKSWDEKVGKQQAKEVTVVLDQWLKQHNVDRKWHMHVKDIEGNFGTLMISNDDKKTLDIAINKLEKESKIDHKKASEGVWWKFTVVGSHLERKISCEPVREPVVINGETFDRIKKAPLTEDDGRKATNELDDLSQTVMILTPTQIKLLVGSSGDPHEVAKIMGLSQAAATTITEEDPVEPHLPADLETIVAAPVASAPVQAPPIEEDEEAVLQRKLEEARARKAAAKQAAPKSTTPDAPASALKAMSNEDFLAMLNTKQA